MITFLAIPRPFTDEFGPLQRMAIGSWQEAMPDDAEVVLFGNETGIEQAAHDLGCLHVPDLEYVEDEPLIDYPFQWAEDAALTPWVCFLSSDLILGGDLYYALTQVSHIERPFLIGQRWDIEPGADKDTAVLHSSMGVDYFIYRPGTIGPVLPFRIRGGGGDNWIVWKAVTAWDMTVIDCTKAITAIHVNHSHPHKRQGSASQVYNRQLYLEDGMHAIYGTGAAQTVLDHHGLHERVPV